MAKIFNSNYSREELQAISGDISQLAGVRISELADGFERGVRTADLYTGSGLRYTVSLDRGMDISAAEFKGYPLAFKSPNGDVHPAFYESHGLEWLRTFKGGLVTTCGLTYLGAPCIDNGESLGLHGRISNIPAHQINYGGYWDGDDYTVFVEGTIREAVQFKDNLSLRRRIESKMGESLIKITDRIKNDGYTKAPFMILYHCNLGFPLLDESSKLITSAKNILPRDEEAAKGLKDACAFSKPVRDYKEQVFYHDMPDGEVVATLENKKIGIELYIKYNKKELPEFIEWKMTGEGTYVLGLEPANCRVEGRDKERQKGTLQFLNPGEERIISLEIGVKSI